jgi:hypothetical protein
MLKLIASSRIEQSVGAETVLYVRRQHGVKIPTHRGPRDQHASKAVSVHRGDLVEVVTDDK